MKRAIILLNGEPYKGTIDASDAFVYCCDGAYNWAEGRVRIDENLGDFDSIHGVPEPFPSKVYPSEKDVTDGEIALREAIAAGYDIVDFYGGGGGREDHFIGNLNLLYQALEQGVRAVLITNYACIFAASGRVVLNGIRGKTVSITPFGGDAHILESRGFTYPLPKIFRYGTTRGISNVVNENVAGFTVDGTVLVFINN